MHPGCRQCELGEIHENPKLHVISVHTLPGLRLEITDFGGVGPLPPEAGSLRPEMVNRCPEHSSKLGMVVPKYLKSFVGAAF